MKTIGQLFFFLPRFQLAISYGVSDGSRSGGSEMWFLNVPHVHCDSVHSP
jgi:hypothetical protein